MVSNKLINKSTMKRLQSVATSFLILGLITSCKEQLDVKQPNQPTVSTASNEAGLISLAQGGTYVNGFKETKNGYYDGVNGYFFSQVYGYHEVLGDEIGIEAANQYANQIGAPDYVLLDDGTKVLNPNSPNQQVQLIRDINQNANAGNNPLYWEWTYMYSLNSAMNKVLRLSDEVKLSSDVKKNTIKAWAYWWKGYAYSRIGSMYYAGLINNYGGDNPVKEGVNNNYLIHDKIIDESNANLDKATAALTAATNADDYTGVMTQLIPSFNQVGKGVVPTVAMFKRNINTLKARNILVNNRTSTMTAAQWGQILTLANDGIQASDNVFTGRSNENGDLLSATAGTVAAKATGDPGKGITYKISERLIQDFKPGDKRLANNFTQLTTPWIGNSDRGNSFNTRWSLVDAGKNQAGVIVISSRTAGATELYIAGSYEENELMKAEAKLYTGDIAGGLKSIDAVRDYQGAGLAALSGLALADAKEELRRERRTGLALRGLSFYDARRMGILEDVSKGGGRKGAVVLDRVGKVNTNATINYNFLDYWDVPDNELAYNAPGSGSAAVKNPR